METSGHGGYSADVKMRLLLGGISIPVAQLGPDFLLLDAANNHPPGEGSLVLSVDQVERSWSVRLPNGITAGSKRVAIAA